ncbi:MAG: PAS domain S-box protein [Planctomycetota bacterium]
MQILDTPPEQAFDDLVVLATQIVGTPVSLMTLVDSERQFFKAKVGVEATETPRDISFCTHAVKQPGQVLVVPNATEDDRFNDNPLVTDGPKLRFYAGAPMVDADGNAVGTLCVADTTPRELAPELRDALQRLARQAMAQLELRRVGREFAERCRELETLDSIVTATDQGVMLVDERNVITFANRAFTKLTGYDVGDNMGQCPRERLCGPETDLEAVAQLRSYVANGESVSRKIRSYTKDGTAYWAETELQPLADSEGRVTQWVVVERDVTRQHEAQLEQQRVEARHRMVLDSSLDAIVTMGPTGLITGWNRQAQTTFGWTEEEAVGRKLSDTIIPEEHRTAHEKSLLHYDGGESNVIGKRIDVTALRRNGETFPAELSIVPLHSDNGLVEFSGFVRDVSEQKAIQDKINFQEKRIASIAANSPGVLYQWRLDQNGEHSMPFASHALSDVFGIDASRAMQDPTPILASVHPEDAEEMHRLITTSATELTPYEWRGRIIRPDGEVRHIHARSRPERLDDGSVLWDGLLTDETDAKRINFELELAKEEAEAASVAKSAFLANMSHEIRTPLSHVISFGELIEQNLVADSGGPAPTVPLPESDRLEAARTICRSGRHLLTVLNDILDISKIEAGRMEVEKVAFDPATVIEEVASLTRVNAGEKGLALDVCYATPIPNKVSGDPTRLRQSLLNLIGNAVKFTETGGILLRVSCDNDKAPTNLVVDVLDSGIGISEEEQQQLFQAFVQADISTTRKFGGTGLGLAISREFVRLMGGDLTCASTPGRGSQFTVTLPIDAEGVDMVLHNSLTDVPSNPNAMLSDTRILVVEDGPENQWLIGIHLRNAGADVVSATDGRAGVEAFNDAQTAGEPFDAILMDMQMPVLDGYGATAELRESGCTIPIIAFTAHAMIGDKDKCLAAGCDAYQTKPIDGPLLVETIRDLVDASRGNASDEVREAA